MVPELQLSVELILHILLILSVVNIVLLWKLLRVLVRIGALSSKEASDLLSSVLGYLFMLIRILNDKNIITKDEYIKLIALKMVLLRYPQHAPEIFKRLLSEVSRG